MRASKASTAFRVSRQSRRTRASRWCRTRCWPKASGGRTHSALEAARFWFGASDYAHNELVDEGAVGSRFTNTEQEGRFELQHVPVATSAGELRGAAGMQIGHRDLTALSFEGGDNLLEPNTTHTTAGFIFEELQATSAPAPAGRGPHRALARAGLDLRRYRRCPTPASRRSIRTIRR